MTGNIRIILEVGTKKTFATALDWPGWSRSGKGTDAAIGELLAYRERYADVLRHGRVEGMPARPTVEVIDQVPGSGTTDFGVPDRIVDADREPFDGRDAERQVSILRACWSYFDQVGQRVGPRMRKGPRGGGRDRDAILEHTIEADRSYGRRVGVRTPPFAYDDRTAVERHREAVFAALLDPTALERSTVSGWPPRYAIRRMAWHVLDHAWEMQDKDLSREPEA